MLVTGFNCLRARIAVVILAFFNCSLLDCALFRYAQVFGKF